MARTNFKSWQLEVWSMIRVFDRDQNPIGRPQWGKVCMDFMQRMGRFGEIQTGILGEWRASCRRRLGSITAMLTANATGRCNRDIFLISLICRVGAASVVF